MKINISLIAKIAVVIATIIICITVYLVAINVYNKERIAQREQERMVTNEQLYEFTNFPKVDSSVSTQPLMNAIIKNFTLVDTVDEEFLNYSNTHSAYEKLINDEVDLIIAPEASTEELTSASLKGVELESIPIIKDGFVFYVSKDNKIENLTIEQVQRIYAGEITNWKDVGGDDEEIIAYQRPKSSESQNAMLSLVMKNLNIIEAPKENLISATHQVTNLISDYKNTPNSIGYSYYSYATKMFQAIDEEVESNVKLVSINGVKPSKQTIQNGSYPLQTTYYIVINKNDLSNSNSRILANQILSVRGLHVLNQAGYISAE